MKAWTGSVIAIVSVAVIICTLFLVLQGKALSFEATIVVVAISAGVVFVVKKIWNLFKKKGGENVPSK